MNVLVNRFARPPAVLRGSVDAVKREVLVASWPDLAQANRALAGLAGDGLAEVRPDGTWQLAGQPARPESDA